MFFNVSSANMLAETSAEVSVNDTWKVSWLVDGVFSARVDTWLENRHSDSVGNGSIVKRIGLK